MASGKVSKEYPFVLIREECDAFSTKKEAIKQAERQWTATHPHHRVPYYVAKAEFVHRTRRPREGDREDAIIGGQDVDRD